MRVSVPENGSFELSILPIADVKPHERTKPSLLSSLERDMQRTGFQRDPIITDKISHVALDGMHRLAALKSLRAKYALCAEFDYLDKSVKLERWLRYVIAPSNSLIRRTITLFDLKQSRSMQDAIDAVNSMESSFAFVSSRRSFLSQTSGNPDEVYDRIARFDRICDSNGVEINFVPEGDRSGLFTSESVFLLYPVSLKKSDVIGLAERGDLLPFKTTRHIVPVRPLGVYFPLRLLSKGNLSKCEAQLKEIVNLSKVKVQKKNIWYEGRRYSEPLALFKR